MVRVHFLLNFSTAPDCPLFGARLSFSARLSSTPDCPFAPDCPRRSIVRAQLSERPIVRWPLKKHLIISASCHALMNFCVCAKYAHNANLLILWERYFFNFIVIRKTFQVKSFTVQRKKNSLFILPHATDEINLLMDYHVTRIKFHSVALSVSTSLFALFWTVDGQFHCYRCIKHIVQFYINETGKLIK